MRLRVGTAAVGRIQWRVQYPQLHANSTLVSKQYKLTTQILFLCMFVFFMINSYLLCIFPINVKRDDILYGCDIFCGASNPIDGYIFLKYCIPEYLRSQI